MLLVWVGFALERLCGCRGGCRRVARQQGGSTVSSSLCTGCCCHDDQCQSLQAGSGATLARLPPCLCCWYLFRVCDLGSLLCIHDHCNSTCGLHLHCTCLDSNAMLHAHHFPKAMLLCLQLQTCTTCTQHTACCYLLLGLVTKYLMSCCCCFHHLSGPHCADLSVHDFQSTRCCFALSCLLLFWFGTFAKLCGFCADSCQLLRSYLGSEPAFCCSFWELQSMVHSRLAPITVLCTAEGHAHYPHTLDLITTYIALLSNGLLLFQY